MNLEDAKTAPRLSATEWRAVTVALRDAERLPCSLSRKEGRIGRLVRWLTGIEAPRPLADPRLEAVRSFVCASRRNMARAREIGAELAGFGYTPSQIEALRLVAR